ncbi:substrate-binding domain-containing protein [Streptomyces kaempferi]
MCARRPSGSGCGPNWCRVRRSWGRRRWWRAELLDGPRPATAVFCFSDSLAYGVYAAAAEASLVVGRDVSVVGFDDHPVSRVLAPPLTTVDWGLSEIAAEAARLTVAAIEGKRVRRKRILCAPRMSERGSAVRV